MVRRSSKARDPASLQTPARFDSPPESEPQSLVLNAPAYIRLLTRAAEHSAGHPQAQRQLATALQETSRLQHQHVAHLEAEARQRGLDADATERLADALRFMGDCLFSMGRPEHAAQRYRRALELIPDDVRLLGLLAKALIESRRHRPALEVLEKAIALQPGDVNLITLAGHALNASGRWDEALSCYQQVLERAPQSVAALSGVALVLHVRGDRQRAREHAARALALAPTEPSLLFMKASQLLAEGRYDEAWGCYEARWQQQGFSIWHTLGRPRWDGEPLKGKCILVCAEQGVGDILQFIRLVRALDWAGAKVLLACAPPVANLLRRCHGVTAIVDFDAMGSVADEIDFFVPMASLPRLLDVTPASLPGEVPYVFPHPDRVAKWRHRLAALGGRLKVGLVWAGNPDHRFDRIRSIPAQIFQPLASLTDVSYVSLQCGPGARESPLLGGLEMLDASPELADYDDTAGLIANLDLLISVDTSVVHLAGAMGRPVWTLIATAPDWRWMHEGETTFWYPTMRLYRQQELGQWAPVVAAVRSDLARILADPTQVGSHLGARRETGSAQSEEVGAQQPFT